MKISKIVLACGISAICAGFSTVRAADSALDAQLREALHQRMNELDAQQPAAPEQPKPVKPVKPVKQKVVEKPAPVVKPAPVATPPKIEAKTPPPVPVAPPPPAIVAAPAPVTTTTDDAQAEQLRQALRARMEEERAQPSTAVTPATTTTTVTQGSDLQPAVSTTTVVPSNPAPKAPVAIEAPVSSLPASKEARLAQLLQQYKTDQISPEQYHVQRAKIIAEP